MAPTISTSLLRSEIVPDSYGLFLKRLSVIFADMDRKYKEAADHYGFHCTGCRDNCCLTRFYHHTLLEYNCLLEGFKTLDKEMQSRVKRRASEVCRQTIMTAEKGQPLRLMCPLNFDSLCSLYTFRPMICRLHGIPHELQQLGQGVIRRPGCGAFSEEFCDKTYFKFDRTPFFMEMAGLEKEFRQVLGVSHKFKMTVAQIIETF